MIFWPPIISLLTLPNLPSFIGHLAASFPSSSPSPFLQSLPDLSPSLQDLLQAFPTVFLSDLKTLSPHHGVQHHIHTTGPPVFAKAHRLNPSRLQQVKAEFDKLEAAGIIRLSNSPWSSPFILFPSLMDPGGPVATTAVSILPPHLTVILFLISKISLPVFMVLPSSPSWTW